MEIEWTENLATNILWIDMQHKYIFTKMKDFINAITAGKDELEIQIIINLVELITNAHFETEESYMLKYDYTDYKLHKTDHEKLTEIIEHIKDESNERGIYSGFTKNIKSVLFQYLTEHIPKFDKPLADFLRKSENVSN